MSVRYANSNTTSLTVQVPLFVTSKGAAAIVSDNGRRLDLRLPWRPYNDVFREVCPLRLAVPVLQLKRNETCTMPEKTFLKEVRHALCRENLLPPCPPYPPAQGWGE